MATSTLKNNFQFFQPIDANIGYVASETTIQTLTRALNANAFPLGITFIGKLNAGSQIFVAGYIYQASGYLYGSIVCGSFNDGGFFKVNQGVITRVT